MLRILAALCLLLPAAPSLAAWVRADSSHFRVFGQGTPGHVAERAQLLEDFHQLLADITGRSPPADAPPLDIFLVDSIADASPWRRLAPDVAGFYRADNGRISAVVLDREAASGKDLGGQEILLHEYAHHFLLGSGHFAYPAWYVEGFAEYFATARFAPGRIELGQVSGNRAAWLQKGEWLPLEKLLAHDGGTRDDAGMFYAQSWLLAHYMFRVPGMREKLVAYLKATGAGEDPVEAFRRHVDPDLAGFQQRLRRYLQMRATFTGFAGPAAPRSDVRLARLSPASERLLLPLVALEHGVPAEASAQALADVRRLAAEAPGDDLAQRALAVAELQQGHAAEAAAILDRLLATDREDPDLLRWRAAAARASGDGERARALLLRARALDPSDWRALHALARLYRPADDSMPPEILALLLRARELAPQVNDLVLDTALALSYDGRLQEAARVLEPLAWSPHGGGSSELARRMLERARAGDRNGLLREVADYRRQRATGNPALPARE